MKIHELFTNPKCWTSGTLARNSDGVSVSYNNPTACQWCLSGAILKLYSISDTSDVCNKIKKYIGLHVGFGVWNDTNGYDAVLKLVKELDI